MRIARSHADPRTERVSSGGGTHAARPRLLVCIRKVRRPSPTRVWQLSNALGVVGELLDTPAESGHVPLSWVQPEWRMSGAC